MCTIDAKPLWNLRLSVVFFTQGYPISSPFLTPPASSNRIETLESIRGLAALLIVFFHIPGWNVNFFDIKIVQHGNLMVELFFVLSGFVIYQAYGQRLSSWNRLLHFQFLRFGRLYPVHFVFLMIFLGIEIAKLVASRRYGVSIPNSVPFRENNLTAFCEQLTLVQAIGPTGNALTFNIPAWSISVEFYTYMMFGLVVLLMPTRKLIAFAFIATASILLLLFTTAFGFTDLLLCTAGFSLGCLTAELSNRLEKSFPSYIGVIFILSIVLLLEFRVGPSTDLAIFPLTAGLVMSLASCGSGWLHWLLSLRAFVWLGGISYSLYMSHETVLWVVNQIFRMILKRPEAIAGGRSVPQLSNAESAIAYPVALCVVLAVAYLTFKFIEDPFRRLSREVARGSLSKL